MLFRVNFVMFSACGFESQQHWGQGKEAAYPEMAWGVIAGEDLCGYIRLTVIAERVTVGSRAMATSTEDWSLVGREEGSGRGRIAAVRSTARPSVWSVLSNVPQQDEDLDDAEASVVGGREEEV
jgi:hypothetical protein